MHAVTARGRWIWAASGLATAVVLAVPGVHLLSQPVLNHQTGVPFATVTRSFRVPDAITRLTVQSQNGPVTVRAGSGPGVQVTEQISYDRSGGAPQPRVQRLVSGGRLTLADPACAAGDCGVAYNVTVPASVFTTASSGGGQVSVTGVAGADVDSGGGPVAVSQISGPVTVSTGGGGLQLDGLTGALHADTGGGPVSATGVSGAAVIATDGGSLSVRGLNQQLQADSGGGPVSLTNITAGAVTVITGGGSARLVFAAAPQSVSLFTDGGPAALDVPGGPYALNTDSDGGPVSVHTATSPSATRTLNVSSGGGSLTIGPGGPGR
ncbi:MAG TPA: hypothetical protein VN847_06400 [Streptosporangiaceae bacterium]|nr:hypothetical protein [Streptosporangiaceae bacterium]